MPEAVTTILDALAIVAVAVGVGMGTAAVVYGLFVAWHPEWLATASGVVAGGTALGTGSWAAGRSGGRT